MKVYNKFLQSARAGRKELKSRPLRVFDRVLAGYSKKVAPFIKVKTVVLTGVQFCGHVGSCVLG
jgi:hypothetical protein